MATRSYTSRREAEQYAFHPAVALLVPLAAVVLQATGSKVFSRLALLDLPLIVTIFFAVARRSPVAGTLTGAAIGLFQDAFTNQPFGIYGMAKALVGYMAASIGVRLDVENTNTRALLACSFSLIQSVLLYLIRSRLMGVYGLQATWLHELLRALANTVIAIPVFFLLDRVKRRE
jgi:rod shape-determining protein MreD